MMLLGAYTVATKEGPLGVWPGAGDQAAHSALLRAHPLTHHGRVDGAGFGRRLASMTVEGRQWLKHPSLVGVGVAGFVDLAQATDGLRPTADLRLNVDAGFGVRLRVPGRDGTIRLDYARGLSDAARALTIGWAR
jgi:hypothetical protein